MKSAVDGYEKPPFYFQEKEGDSTRTVAWVGDERSQEKVFFDLLNVIGDRIDYLLKEADGFDEEEIRWKRIQGGILHSNLVEVIENNKDWFFGDGGFQFCARIAEHPDYFAYDDHGIFWIYSDLPEFKIVLERNGVEEREDNLITSTGHWHIHQKDSEIKADKFRSDLTALSVYTNES